MFVNCIVFWCDKKLLIRRFIKSSKKTYSYRLSFCETKTPQPRARRTVEEHLWLFRFLSLPFSFLRLFVPSSFLPFFSLFLPSFRSISFLCLISLFFLFTFFFCPFPFFFLFHYFLSSFFSFSCLSSLFFRSLSFSLFLFALFFTFYPFSSVIKHCSPVTETS